MIPSSPDPIESGDVFAFNSLVDRYRRRTYATALQILRDPADAADVTQDAMLKAWIYRSLWRSDQTGAFQFWLRKVVINRCIDFRRRAKFERLDDIPEIADACADAVTVMHRRQLADRLAFAINELPSSQRCAIGLAYFDELANSEVAATMGTTVQAVESLLKRGRNRLRRILRTRSE